MANRPEDQPPKLFPQDSAPSLPSVPPLSCPPLLQPSSDYPRWKRRMQAFLDVCPAAHHFVHVCNNLSDDAFARADAAGFSKTNSMQKNWEILDQCFDLRLGSQHTLLQLLSRRQLPGESFLEYLNALQLLAAGLDNHDSPGGTDQLVCTRFVEGMLPGDLRTNLRRQLPANTSHLQKIILRFTDAENDHVPTPSTSMCPVSTKPNAPPVRRNRSRSQQRSNGDATRRCYYCQRFGKKARKCGHNRQPDRKRNADVASLEQEEDRLARLVIKDDN
ncbi:unnamed protein product [Trichobilharzia szidati]|nr:unnamed protein product [Trichobilharzia szidati]